MIKFPKSVLTFYFKNLFHYAKGWPFLYLLVSAFDTAGHTIIPAFFIKMVIASLENSPVPDAFMNIIPIAIVYFFVRSALVGGAVLRWVVFDNCIKYRSYNKISKDLYDYVFNQSIDFYSNSMPGKINSQINGVATGFYDTVGMVFGTAVATLCAFILGLGGLFAIGWQYLLVIGLAVFARIAWGMWRVKYALRASAKTAQTLNHLQGRLLDALSNFLTVKTFARADWEQKYVKESRTEYEKVARNGHATSRWFWGPGNFMMDAVGMTALIVLCGYMYSTGQSSIADVSFALSVFVGISALSFSLIMETKTFVEKWGSAVGSYNGLIHPIKIQDDTNAKNLVVKKAVIEVKNVDFKYTKKLFKDFTLEIAPGKSVGLVGVSGSGKSTLTKLLLRFADVEAGAIYIDGQDIKHVTQKSLRENIAFIPQDTTMFNRTIRENIMYGRTNATDKEIIRAARDADADKFILSTPHKYNTYIGDRGIKLSGGQRQRIAIARAFLKDAPILVLDEATSALDSETEMAIQKSFDKLSRGRTTIAIAHHLSTLRNMDRIVVLDKGIIIEQGTHNTLLRKKGEYYKLWKMQSGGFLQEK